MRYRSEAVLLRFNFINKIKKAFIILNFFLWFGFYTWSWYMRLFCLSLKWNKGGTLVNISCQNLRLQGLNWLKIKSSWDWSRLIWNFRGSWVSHIFLSSLNKHFIKCCWFGGFIPLFNFQKRLPFQIIFRSCFGEILKFLSSLFLELLIFKRRRFFDFLNYFWIAWYVLFLFLRFDFNSPFNWWLIFRR